MLFYFVLCYFPYTGYPSLGTWAAGILTNLKAWVTPTPSPVIFRKGNKPANPGKAMVSVLPLGKGNASPQDGAPSSLTGLPPSQHPQSIWKFSLQVEISCGGGAIFLLLINKVNNSSESA